MSNQDLHKLKRNKSGFTILELLIASTIFSTILLLCTYGIILVGRNYYKGIKLSQAQNSSRRIMDNISKSIQYSEVRPDLIQSGSNTIAMCIGTDRYSFKINQRSINDSDRILTQYIVSNPGVACTQAIPNPIVTESRELLPKGFRITKLQIVETLVNSNIYNIELSIAYGEDDLINPSGQCVGGAGSQFCATSNLVTTVKRKLN